MGNSLLTTFTGKNVDVLNLRSEDICLEDIAHSLALTCRFGGHCSQFYSVAEHSVRASYFYRTAAEIIPLHLHRKICAKYLLFHDAAEAYLVDIPRPVKQRIPQFKKIEEKIIDVIMSLYIGDEQWILDKYQVELADNIMLVTEARDLMPASCDRLPDVDMLVERIDPWSWEAAEQRFLGRAKELGIYD